jgi:hypothetical protein
MRNPYDLAAAGRFSSAVSSASVAAAEYHMTRISIRL